MALPTSLKTPGVYIEEKNAFPNSVVAVETAVPAFLGYTEKAEFGGQSLKNKPVRIESFTEFELYYGKGFQTQYDLIIVDTPTETPQNYDFKINTIAYLLKETAGTKFNLYDSMKFFYQNGGGSCFIISIGTYEDIDPVPFSTTEPFIQGIDLLKKETEPTMLLIPDAVLFKKDDCYNLQVYMLMHCGEQRNKVALLDIYDGDKGFDNPTNNPIDNFRNQVSSSFLSYGAAYYPWLHTTIVQSSEVNYCNLSKDGRNTLASICTDAITDFKAENKAAIINYLNLITSPTPTLATGNAQSNSNRDPNLINTALAIAIPQYKLVIDNILKKKNLLPPAAAMAGIYTLVDSQRGVWKAPANVAVSSVVAPAVLIDNEQQQDLNLPLDGKAICAIRTFIGMGTMVWGARTLDGNSQDWHYINVRRTIIMLEQSIKFAARAYIFEPNEKNTWVSIESMIENFLTNLWKLGALAGAVPADAFSVSVGLGSTMTAGDILEGRINIEVKVAISCPAEFIVIIFQQQQQKS